MTMDWYSRKVMSLRLFKRMDSQLCAVVLLSGSATAGANTQLGAVRFELADSGDAKVLVENVAVANGDYLQGSISADLESQGKYRFSNHLGTVLPKQ